MDGLYVCYDEKKRGNFEDAVEISNREYLIWRHHVYVRRRLKYPAKIIIKIKGEDRYYKGNLLLVTDYKDFNSKIIENDFRHRPSVWKNAPEKEWKSVFFIVGLQKTPKPDEISDIHPPRRIAYLNFDNLSRRQYNAQENKTRICKI